MVSYAFLPIQKEPKYSGIYLMSNYENDNLRKEPFIKMFNPETYEKAKFTPEYSTARVSALPQNNSYIVAFKLPEDLMILKDGQKTSLPDLENGHHMAVISAVNANSGINYPNRLFTSIIQNASLGKRGEEVLELATNTKQTHNHSTRATYTPFIQYQQRQSQK
jgi:hypothetical protein